MYDRDKAKEYYVKNRESILEKEKNRRLNNKEKYKDKDHNKYLKTKDKCSERNKKYRESHKEEISLSMKEYYKSNKDKWLVSSKKSYHIRKEDPKYRLRKSVSCLIRSKLYRKTINKNYFSSFSFLPYSLEELMEHLESRFQVGMSWKNYGEWHIDHIVPDSSFNYKSIEDEEFKECWSLDNLQPLWAIDNIKKSNKTL